jgi:hypothetical protein
VAPEAGRMAATWGLPGSYDPLRRYSFAPFDAERKNAMMISTRGL